MVEARRSTRRLGHRRDFSGLDYRGAGEKWMNYR